MASSICGTPIAFVSLVDSDRQWLKSTTGFDLKETSRDVAFCAHTILQTDPLVVEDSLKDIRFFDNPLVSEDSLRFYAGAPLIDAQGFALGTLCVVDNKPNHLTGSQLKSLQALSRQVVMLLELKISQKKLTLRLEEIKDYARIIKEHEHQLVTTAKMSALGEIAAGLAHEINNPISIMISSAMVSSRELQKEHPNLTAINTQLKAIQETGLRASKIAHSLLSFSRDSPLDPLSPVRASGIVNTTLEFCRERLQKNNVELRLNLAEDSTVNCVSNEVSQVLLNLLNNSLDAISPLAEKWIEISLKKSSNEASISVTDSGREISPETLQKMFIPFYTTKEVGKGVGMGLSLSKTIMEKHGGSLVFEPREGFSSFVMKFPLK